MDKKNDAQERLDNLRETVMYAPLGLLYEYDEVVPKLVRRGKSQVQIAKLVGKAATGRSGIEQNVSEVANHMGDFLTKALLEAGDLLGLIPDTTPQASSSDSTATAKASPASPKKTSSGTAQAAKTAKPKKKKKPAAKAKKQAVSLPIAGYDSLKAKEIVQLVGDLSVTQRATVRKHEEANRARKTILAKLDRLDR